MLLELRAGGARLHTRRQFFVVRPAGRLKSNAGPAIAPGSFSGLAAASGHNFRTKKIRSLRPRGTSAKNWSPDPIGTAVISFEWIAQGFTAKSFWTVLRRSIAALEGR